MTDRIDLDELDVSNGDGEDRPNRGDWFWRNDGGDGPTDGGDGPTESSAPAPSDEEGVGGLADAAVANADGEATEGVDGGSDETGDPDAGSTAAESSGVVSPDIPAADAPAASEAYVSDDANGTDDRPPATPRVPYTNDDRPVGIPMESGGGGGVPADAREEGTQQQPDASGPHGGGADEMTMAISYVAIRRLEDLHAALADAETWTDWVGIVGDVDAHVLTKFQRENRLDLDFFNGTGTGPAERLAEVDEHSMFYAKRMVLVGVEDAGERAWAEAAGWEFVPVAEAAEGAGWSLSDP
ncbi:DUF7124 domain-containing protein [Halorarum salinum]|uniref:DUF7124 domain-containing protein n=1 Tax=Halorarum salinum TaxID=2743089 RepID=A0A7D5QJG3_9EURY|nr:hypothetical protein [Halobaculum salinum]QLG61405.1 hypothetical protein HUG12_06520 [Halobaculum salinum]